jgi:hypothetical protein
MGGDSVGVGKGSGSGSTCRAVPDASAAAGVAGAGGREGNSGGSRTWWAGGPVRPGALRTTEGG